MLQISEQAMEAFKAKFPDVCIFCERSRIPGLSESEADQRLDAAIRKAREILVDTRDLLSKSDPKALARMKQSLGSSDPEAVRQIIELIDKELGEIDNLSVANFEGDPWSDKVATAQYSWIGKEKGPLKIKIGKVFAAQGEIADATTIIHELSHFRRVSDTKDDITGSYWWARPTEPMDNAIQIEIFFQSVAGDLSVARSRAARLSK